MIFVYTFHVLFLFYLLFSVIDTIQIFRVVYLILTYLITLLLLFIIIIILIFFLFFIYLNFQLRIVILNLIIDQYTSFSRKTLFLACNIEFSLITYLNNNNDICTHIFNLRFSLCTYFSYI